MSAAVDLRGWWGRIVARYGWRPYALAVLSVVTVVALAGEGPFTGSAIAGPGPSGTATPTAPPRPSGSLDTVPASVLVVGDLGDDASACAANGQAQFILVSIKLQHLWACEGAKEVNSVPVTTGKGADNDQTPLGSWRVQAKERDRYLVGPGYVDYVQYWVPFNGDFGLHDASWQTMPFGSPGYVQDGSHGCVHLPTPAMSWLYQWATVGTTVVTVEA